MKHIRRVAAVALATWVAACSPPPPPARPPPEVSVATPLQHPVDDWDEYTGRLAAVDRVEIRARVSGYLQSVHFQEGALVARGDLLAVIDPRPYEAAQARAEAERAEARVRLALADNEFARAERLFKTRNISEEDFDERSKQRQQAAAAVAGAEASLRRAALDVEFTKVRAPVKGLAGRKLVTEGNLISGGSDGSTLLTTVVSLDPIHAYMTADERAFLRYVRLDREGKQASARYSPVPVRMELLDESGFPHLGHMDFVDNQVDTMTGTMLARAVFPNPDLLLTPGLFVRMRLAGGPSYQALLVPDAAIGSDQSQRFVFVLDAQNLPQRRTVVLGRMVGSLRVIASGLVPTDRVVVNGVQRLRAGAPVTVKETTIQPPEPEPPPKSETADLDESAVP
jgi:multidrug efflux system membrane fusion protein